MKKSNIPEDLDIFKPYRPRKSDKEREILRKIGTIRWKSKSKEEKQSHSQRTINQFKNRTEEERDQITEKQSKTMKKLAAKRDPSHYLNKKPRSEKAKLNSKKVFTQLQGVKCAVKSPGSNKWKVFDSFTIASEHFNMPHWKGTPNRFWPKDGSVYTGTKRTSKGYQFKRILTNDKV